MFAPRFSLRVFLLAVTTIAVVLAIWAESVREQRRGVAWVLAQGGHVTYDFEWPEANGSYPMGAKPRGPTWLHDWLGIDYFASVTAVILDRDEITDLAPLADLPQLRCLGLMIEVDPQTDFSSLQRLKRLEELHLNYTGLDEQAALRIKTMLPKCRIRSQTNPQLEY